MLADLALNDMFLSVILIKILQNILAASLATGVVIDISLAAGLSALLWKEYMRGTFMLKSYVNFHLLQYFLVDDISVYDVSWLITST